MLRRGAKIVAAFAVGAGGTYSVALGMGLLEGEFAKDEKTRSLMVRKQLPSRQQLIQELKSGDFDVLVIGGGATGAGCALDAATRGLKTALVEREDYAAGTSSRSTKLIHGGVRYLEKAVFQLDYGQLKLVFEALHERRNMMNHAPHLTNALPIITPCYKFWEIPYYWAGLKAYDLVAGTQALFWSSFMSARSARRLFPTLAPAHADGSKLKGTIVYFDGQMDDSRMNVSVALTAIMAGAACTNYVEVTELIKDAAGQVTGAKVKDVLSGEVFSVKSKVVINAAGPFVDALLEQAYPDMPKLVTPSGGVHVTLPDFYSPDNMGLIVPKTKDGRVVFMLPWQGHTIAGTTDNKTPLTMRPEATEEDVEFILDSIRDYLTVKVRRSDVLSSWCGIRPLVADPSSGNTENITRDHLIIARRNMVTITGGKWTTYRLMAEDAINRAVDSFFLTPDRECQTDDVRLIGAEGWSNNVFSEIAQTYTVPHRPGHIDISVAKHLSHAYGMKAFEVTRIAESMNLGQRLVRGHPFLEAEVVYCVRHEYSQTINDFLARRSRFAFTDANAAEMAIPRVADLMAQELGWDEKRKQAEIASAKEFMKTFKGGLVPQTKKAASAA